MLNWFKKYSREVTWWVIGWLSFSLIDALSKAEYGFVALNIGLIALNYFLWKRNQ